MKMTSDFETVLGFRWRERNRIMNTSLSWLKAYVPDLDVTAQEYTDAMTLSGTKVEGYEQLDADLERLSLVRSIRLKSTRMQTNWSYVR